MEREKIDKKLNSVIKTCFLLLVVLTPFIIETHFFSFKLLFIQLMISLIIFCYGLKFIFGKVKLYFSNIFLFVLAYIAVVTFSYFSSNFPQISRLSLLRNLSFVSFFFIFSFTISSREYLNKLIKAWILTAIVLALYGIIQFFGLGFLNLHYEKMRIISTMGNPNFLAGYLVVTLPLCLYQIYISTTKGMRILYIFTAVIIGITTILTYSRGSYLALLIGVGLFFLLMINYSTNMKKEVKKYKTYLWIGGISIIIIFIATLLYFPGIKRKLVGVFTRPTARNYIWEGAFRMISNNPWKGIGLGNFPLYFPKFSPQKILLLHPSQFQYVKHTHNIFLEIWVENGIVGMLVFLGIIGASITKVFRKISWDVDFKLENLFLISIFSSFCGIIVMNLVNVTVYYAVGGFFFWLILSMLLILTTSGKKSFIFNMNSFPQKILSYFIALSVILFSLSLAGCNLRPFITKLKIQKKQEQKNLFFFVDSKVNQDFINLKRKAKTKKATAEDYYDLGTIYAKRREWDEALKYYKKSVQLNPDYYKAYNNLGNVYYNKGKIKKAIKNYKKAVKCKSDYVEARYNLGIMYFKTGKVKETVEEMKTILKINPDYYEAKAVINEIGG